MEVSKTQLKTFRNLGICLMLLTNHFYYFRCDFTISQPYGSQYDSGKTLTLSSKAVQRICPKPVKRSELQFCSWDLIYCNSFFSYFREASVDGSWGSWSSWSHCTQSCGEGTRSRSRLCDSPAPARGGEDCPGEPSENRACYNNKCKLDDLVTSRVLTLWELLRSSGRWLGLLEILVFMFPELWWRI